MLKNIFFFIFLLSIANLQAQDPEQQNQNGRYQITTAYAGGTGAGVYTEIYMVDTQTGKVWMSKSTTLGYYRNWYELPPLPHAEQY